MSYDLTSNFDIPAAASVEVAIENLEVLLLSLELEEAKMEELMVQTQQLDDIEDGLDEVAAFLEDADETVLTPEVAAMVQIATENAMRALGDTANKIFAGLESADTFANKEIALESIGETISKVKGAVTKVIGSITAKAISLFDKIFNTVKGLERKAVELKKKLSGLEKETDKEVIKVASLKALHVNGSVETSDILKGIDAIVNTVTVANGSYLEAVEAHGVTLTKAFKEAKLEEIIEEDDTPEEVKAKPAFQKVKEVFIATATKSSAATLAAAPKPVLLPGGREIVSQEDGQVEMIKSSKVSVANKSEQVVPSHAEIGKLLDGVIEISQALQKGNRKTRDLFALVEVANTGAKIPVGLRPIAGTLITLKAAASGLAGGVITAGTGSVLQTAVFGGAAINPAIAVVGVALASTLAASASVKNSRKNNGRGTSEFKLMQNYLKPVARINAQGFRVAKHTLTYASAAMNAYDKSIVVESFGEEVEAE